MKVSPSPAQATEELPPWLSDAGPTPVINVLIVTNVLAFLALTAVALLDIFKFSGGNPGLPALIEVLVSIPGDTLLNWGANAATVTVLDHQYWRLLTNTFLHTNFLHLGMNMYVLWDFNRQLERLYGSSKFITIYLLSGLGSSICSLLFLDPSSVSAGASGAIFGVFGATVAFFWAFRKEIPRKFFLMHQKMFFIFLIYCVVSSQMFPGMDNAAHLGGFLVGLWTALCLLPSSPGSHSWAKGNFLKLSCLTLILVTGLEMDIRMSRENPKVVGELEYQRAIKLLKQERFEDAVKQLEKASQITPSNASIYADEALALNKLKQPDLALAAAKKALALDPKNRKAVAASGVAFHHLGDYQKAIEVYSCVIKADARAAVALNNRAWSYNALNLPDNAIADSTRAIQVDAQLPSSYDTRGVAYCLKQQYEPALQDFNKYIALNPKDGAVYYHRAFVFLKQDKISQARVDLERAKKSDYQLETWETKTFQDLWKL